jgi:hypothetical protein
MYWIKRIVIKVVETYSVHLLHSLKRIKQIWLQDSLRAIETYFLIFSEDMEAFILVNIDAL